jgi:histidinol-phosphate phosphatase family protein
MVVLDIFRINLCPSEHYLFCPHAENDDCECRKPKPKLLLDAAKEFGIDLLESWMIGDRASDVMTGVNAGVKTILVKTGVPTVESDKATFTAPSLLEAVQYIAKE